MDERTRLLEQLKAASPDAYKQFLAQERFEREIARRSALPKAELKKTKFKEPSSEQFVNHHRANHGVSPEDVSNYYTVNCVHDRPKWEICGMCRRTSAQAKRNLLMLAHGRAKEMRQ